MTTLRYEKQVTLWVKDKALFESELATATALWYEKFGETLTRGEVLLKSMTHLNNMLSGKTSNDNSGQNIHKYRRTGLSPE